MSVNGNRNCYRSFYGFNIHLTGLAFLTSLLYRAQDDDAPLGKVRQCNYIFATDPT